MGRPYLRRRLRRAVQNNHEHRQGAVTLKREDMPDALTSEELRADLGNQLKDASPSQILWKDSLSKLPLHRVVHQTIHKKRMTFIQDKQHESSWRLSVETSVYLYLYPSLLRCAENNLITLQVSSWLSQKAFAAKLHAACQNAFLAFSVPNFPGRPTVSRQRSQGVFNGMNQGVQSYCRCRLRAYQSYLS